MFEMTWIYPRWQGFAEVEQRSEIDFERARIFNKVARAVIYRYFADVASDLLVYSDRWDAFAIDRRRRDLPC